MPDHTFSVHGLKFCEEDQSYLLAQMHVKKCQNWVLEISKETGYNGPTGLRNAEHRCVRQRTAREARKSQRIQWIPRMEFFARLLSVS